MCTGLILCNPNHCSDALQVYAPWCGHCKKLEPEYNRLGEVLQNIPSIVIEKVDDTKNEHALVQVKEFPTILFFPAGNKSKEPPVSSLSSTRHTSKLKAVNCVA
jgi:thiol-disulfide isomerase/thioredoxin